MLTDPVDLRRYHQKILMSRAMCIRESGLELLQSQGLRKIRHCCRTIRDRLGIRFILRGKKMLPAHVQRLPENVLTPEINEIILSLEEDWHGTIPILADAFADMGLDEWAEACLLQQKLITRLDYKGRVEDENRLLALDDKGIYCPRLMGEEIYKDVPFYFTFVPPGVFYFGVDRIPTMISEGNWIASFNFTQRQWMTLRAENPASNQSDLDNPVERVSWNDIDAWIKEYNKQKQSEFDMVTEAQWEYSCRAGIFQKFPWGEDVNRAKDFCWYAENSGGRTQPVGRLRPNLFGLYDMLGNTWEWVKDSHDPENEHYHRDNYDALPKKQKVGRKSKKVFTDMLRMKSRGYIKDMQKRKKFVSSK